MPIQEKYNQFDDFYIYEIFRDPVLFGEFLANYDKREGDELFEFSSYQKEWLNDFSSYMSLCCSRAVGKTLYLSYYILWLMVYNVFPQEYINYHVPGKNHLEPVFTQLVKMLRTNSLLKQFISEKAGVNQSDYKITLLNQASLLCRIAGQTGTGVSVVGLHSPVVIFDESGYYPWATWQEGQPTVNTFEPGFKEIVSGVPDGRREKSVCFHCDQENSNYSKHRVNSYQNPRFSEKDRIKAIEQYGGEDTEDYIHLVLGLHGRAVFTLFDRANMELKDYPVYKLSLSGFNLGDIMTEYYSRIHSLPPIPDKNYEVIIGVDLGYTEPSAIIVMYLNNYKQLHFHARIKLDKVSFPIQEKIIDMLDSKYSPGIVAIDEGAGGQGISVIHHLKGDMEYIQKNYDKRIVPVNFSSWTILGIDQNGEEIKTKTKPYATSTLQDYVNNHKIIFSHKDLEMVTELERMTYTRNPNGDIAYHTLTARGGQRGEDHFTSSLLVLTLAYYLQNEYINQHAKKTSLFKGGWFRQR